MNFKEYGSVIEENAHPSFKEYGKVVDEPSRARSLFNAPIRGAVEKTAGLMEFIAENPIGRAIRKIPTPQELFSGKEAEKVKPWEKIREFSEENLPIQEHDLEKYLERAGGLGLESLVTPGGPIVKAAKALGGAALGHGLEKVGAPAWAQAIAESAPFFYSGGKKIPLTKQQKGLGEFLRKQGLTENEIAPLLKTEQQLNTWSKWASKGPKSKELMEAIYQKSGGIYDSIVSEGKNLPALSSSSLSSMLSDIEKITKSMPTKYRNLIKGDLSELKNSRKGAEDLINFWTDINAVIGPEVGGKAIVGKLKDPLSKALSSISPELSSDFDLARKLYGTRANVSGHILNKRQLDELIDLGEAMQFGGAIANRDMGKIASLIGLTGARKIAREMIINPRLQNISVRIGEAIKKNKYALAEKLVLEFNDSIKEK